MCAQNCIDLLPLGIFDSGRWKVREELDAAQDT